MRSSSSPSPVGTLAARREAAETWGIFQYGVDELPPRSRWQVSRLDVHGGADDFRVVRPADLRGGDQMAVDLYLDLVGIG
jgi:hypothetical protein